MRFWQISLLDANAFVRREGRYNNNSMATLTEVSFYTRKAVKWGAVIFVILLTTPAVLKGARALYLLLRPPPPPPPTVKYGRLPAVYFPENQTEIPTYTLETINGQLPALPDVGRVYFVEINKSRLLEVDRLKSKARLLGFTNEPQESSEGKVFNFAHPTLPATLTANIISMGLKYKLAWETDQALFTNKSLPTPEQAKLETKSFLQNLNLLAPDLTDGIFQHTFYRFVLPSLQEVSSLSEADLIRVDLYRANKDELPFVTTQGNRSPVNFLFSGVNDRTKRVVEFEYQYSNILDDNFATYPLRPVDIAWNDLVQGNGYVAVSTGNNVTIRNVYLAYYESSQPQEFLQPVYVFEGDSGFIGYVPAVSPDYLEDSATENLNTPTQ